MKILVITARFAISGVPLAQVRLARSLEAEGHDVDLMFGYVDPAFKVPAYERLNVIILDKRKVRSIFRPLRRYLRERRPDVIFSAEDHLNAIVLLAAITTRSSALISGSCRVRPFDTYSSVPFSKRWILKQLMRFVQWRANALTCVSQDMIDQYRRVFRSPPHKSAYNIVDDEASRMKACEPLDEPWLTLKDEPVVISAGALQPWKGFADLIAAVGIVTERRRRVRVIILGEGPLHAELVALANKLGIADRVKLLGAVDNPLKYFARADVFVLSSHVEGLPNVLVEAMMCGCTPVSTNCPTGPREVLQNGRFGYLIPVGDPEALADGIEQALDKPIPDSDLALAVSPFQKDAVINRHSELLGIELRKCVST